MISTKRKNILHIMKRPIYGTVGRNVVSYVAASRTRMVKLFVLIESTNHIPSLAFLSA